MAIDVIVIQRKGGFLPDILLLTQAPIFVWFDGTIILLYYYYPVSSVLKNLSASRRSEGGSARRLRL